MPRPSKKQEQTPLKEIVPELDPVARQAQLINLAELQAEKQMLEGTAPAQIVVHYLKLATIREQKELELLERQTQLAQAKIDAIEAGRREEELYSQAIEAMKIYGGGEGVGDGSDIF